MQLRQSAIRMFHWPSLANDGAFQPPVKIGAQDRPKSTAELDSINDVKESAFHRKTRRFRSSDGCVPLAFS